MAWNVKFFQTTRGDYPVKELIEEQDEATYAKVLQAIKLLANNGPFLKPPYIKKLQDKQSLRLRLKLYELRISGTVALRIFYTIYNNEYYLLHALKKKSQKTPTQEIKTALDRMKEIV